MSENAVLGPESWFGADGRPRRTRRSYLRYARRKREWSPSRCPDGEVFEFEPIARPFGSFKECQLVPIGEVTV